MKYFLLMAAMLLPFSAEAQQGMPDINQVLKNYNKSAKTPPSKEDYKKMFDGIDKQATAQKKMVPVDTTPCKGLVEALESCSAFSCTVKNRLGTFTKTSVAGAGPADTCLVNIDISDGKFMHCAHGPERMKALINITKKWMVTGLEDNTSKDAKTIAPSGVDGTCKSNLK